MSFDFGPIMDANIAPSTISFLKIANPAAPVLFGSGTLVKCRNLRGILTCGHVFEAVATQNEIGILLYPVVSTTRQQFKIDVPEFVSDSIIFSATPKSADGPDLAFIPLPDQHAENLASLGTFVDLDIGKTRAFTSVPVDEECFEAVSGAIQDLTPPLRIEDKKAVQEISGLMNVGNVISTVTLNGFDIVTFQPNPGPNFKLPASYGGTSGGGIWRVLVKKQENGCYSHRQNKLIGVAFWETDLPNRKIIGHGPESICENLLDEINRRWP